MTKDNDGVEEVVQPSESEQPQLRRRGVWRSVICPGTGFALLGRKRWAVATYLVSVLGALAIAWTCWHPREENMWVLLGTLAVAFILWIAEQVAVKRLHPREPGPGFLAGGFLVASLVMWGAAIGAAALIVLNFASARMTGEGMEPTLLQGELVLYHKRVEPDRLVRGKVIIYRLSDKAAEGEAGSLVVSRILAVPGDKLSINKGNYTVNGEEAHPVAEPGLRRPVIRVPLAPDSLVVPDNCYFMVQDKKVLSYDSRVLSWARAEDLVGTRLFYLRKDSLLQLVE